MKKIINWFRDLLYNFTDYAIILCVITAVAVILLWRFNILFNFKIDKDTIQAVEPPITVAEDNSKDNKDDTNNENNANSGDNPDESNSSDNKTDDTLSDFTHGNSSNSSNSNDGTDNIDESTNIDTATGKEVTFNIPSGAFPSKIGDILLEKGLINDKQLFLTRCVELSLDTKLKPGDFTIKAGTALDDIIKIIAK